MSRTIQVGDLALVNGTPFIIREITPSGILISSDLTSPERSLLISKDGIWQVYGYTVPHTVTFGLKLESCDDFEKIRLTPEEIRQRRQLIYDRILPYLLNDPNRAGEMTNQHLMLIFQLYDHLWFQGRLGRFFDGTHNLLNLEFGKGTSIGGSCKLLEKGKLCTHTISISRPVFSKPFTNPVETVNGLQCTNHLSCLQLVFEHELIHLILNLWCRNQQGHGAEFQNLAKNLFGHTSYKHMIGRGMDVDPEVYLEKVKDYLRPGMIVRVKNDEGISKYQVIQVDRKTLLGVNQENQKRYRVSLLGVLLPDEEDETEEEILPFDDPYEKAKNYLRPGMIVRTKIENGKEFKVERVDRKNFVGLSIPEGNSYRISLLSVIIPEESSPQPVSPPPVSGPSENLKYTLQPGMVVTVKERGVITKYRVVTVNRRANAKTFVGISERDQKEYRVPFDLVIFTV